MKEAILVFDVSGSIDSTKKGYYKSICDHYRSEYRISTVITHTTEAKKFNCFSDGAFDKVISKPEAGGTYISSGLVLAAGEILKGKTDVVIIFCGDGDNWCEDNEDTFNVIRNLNSLGAEIIYHEILPATYSTPMSCRFKKEEIPCKTYIVRDRDCDIFGNNKKKEFILYGIQHAEFGKVYYFRSDELPGNFELDEFVICQTKKSNNSYGRIYDVRTKEMSLAEYNDYKKIGKLK